MIGSQTLPDTRKYLLGEHLNRLDRVSTAMRIEAMMPGTVPTKAVAIWAKSMCGYILNCRCCVSDAHVCRASDARSSTPLKMFALRERNCNV
jgi:hypothetical protein